MGRSRSTEPGPGVPRGLSFRTEARPSDAAAVREIVASTGFFSEEEIDLAVGLADERIRDGAERSGYHFVFAERAGRVVGYLCFGPIPATRGSFDLYWIAVRDDCRGRGFGQALLRAGEREMARLGARKVYIETSSRPQYQPTRAFYEAHGYRRECILADYYGPDDGKVIYSGTISSTETARPH